MEQKTGKQREDATRIFFFFFFVGTAFLLSAEKSSSAGKENARPSLVKTRIKLNMTARITYKRRYVLDALVVFFCAFARRRSFSR